MSERRIISTTVDERRAFALANRWPCMYGCGFTHTCPPTPLSTVWKRHYTTCEAAALYKSAVGE